jgi:hypothetical protein
METVQELRNNESKSLLMKELDELENHRKDIEPNSAEAYQLSLLAFKKINKMLSL